jgi:hypothetical protein
VDRIERGRSAESSSARSFRGPEFPALTGNRVLYRDGVAVGALVAGEIRWLETLAPADLRRAESMLIRSTRTCRRSATPPDGSGLPRAAG